MGKRLVTENVLRQETLCRKTFCGETFCVETFCNMVRWGGGLTPPAAFGNLKKDGQVVGYKYKNTPKIKKILEYLRYLRFNPQNTLVQRDRGVHRGRMGVSPPPPQPPSINKIYESQRGNSASKPLPPQQIPVYIPGSESIMLLVIFQIIIKQYLRERERYENKLCIRIHCIRIQI